MKPICLAILTLGLAAVPTVASAADAVTCSNPAGMCTVEQSSGECMCGNGEGAAWSDGYNPDDPAEPKTEEELLAQCEDELVMSCGEDPPALPPSCEGEVRQECEAFVAAEDELIQACGDDVSAVKIARIGACCDTHDDPEYAAYRDCVSATDEATCEALDACEGGGDTEDGDASAHAEEMDDDKAACSVGRRGGAWELLALFGFLPLLRRRRDRRRRGQ